MDEQRALVDGVFEKLDRFAAELDDRELVVLTALLQADGDAEVEGFRMPQPFKTASLVGDVRVGSLIAQIDGLVDPRAGNVYLGGALGDE